MGRAGDRLDRGQGVAIGRAAAAGAQGQLHRHTDGAVGIVGGVEAGAAVEVVRPGPAAEDVGGGIAGQGVGIGRAGDELDRDQDVAGGGAAAGGTSGEIYRYARVTVGIAGEIVAVAAVEPVGGGAAGQGVGMGGAGDRLDRDQGVATGSAAACRCRWPGSPSRPPCCRRSWRYRSRRRASRRSAPAPPRKVLAAAVPTKVSA